MTDNSSVEDGDLKRKLVRRVAFAGALIAMLLGALAFIDYLGQPSVEEPVSGPTYTSPVPVGKKEITQPVTPAESPAPVASPAAIEPPQAPVPAVAEAPTAAPTLPAPVTETPARPEVAAQPMLPRVAPRSHAAGAPSRSAAAAAEEASSAPAPRQPEASPAPQPMPARPPERAIERVPPAPPRLFSGYAVQAGVFSDAEHAEELRAKLLLNGIPSTLEARVQLGPFKNRAEAEAAREKLKTLGIDGILLPPKGAKR